MRSGFSQAPYKGRGTIVAASSLFILIAALLSIYRPPFVRFLDNKFYDSLARVAPYRERAAALTPVIVDVDEKSLARLGQWPWPRYRLATLLDRLREMGPSAVGLDMVFPERDRTSFKVLKAEILRDLEIDVPMGRIPETLMDHDKTLAGALSRGPFVLGYKFTFSEAIPSHEPCVLHPLSVSIISEKGAGGVSRYLFRAQDTVCSLPVLAEHAASSGFLNVVPDVDGMLRRAPLIMEQDGRSYPSLALATLILAGRVKRVSLVVRPGGIESILLDNTLVPVDAKGELLIRYRGAGRTFDYVSASDVLQGLVPAERIKGRIVFVGTSAGGLADRHPAPVDAVFPGVEIHANIVDNILMRDFFSRPAWAPGVELLLVIGAGVISMVLLAWAGALWSFLFLCLGIFCLPALSLWMLYAGGVYLSPLAPVLALCANFSLITLLKYGQERRRVNARTKELSLTQDFTIRCLASLTETRDSETGGHILRTQQYVLTLCRQLATKEAYHAIFDEETIERLYKSAPLHDIGKVGVPDYILLKPGKLTPEEFEEMKKHTTYGRDAIQRAESGHTEKRLFWFNRHQGAYPDDGGQGQDQQYAGQGDESVDYASPELSHPG